MSSRAEGKKRGTGGRVETLEGNYIKVFGKPSKDEEGHHPLDPRGVDGSKRIVMTKPVSTEFRTNGMLQPAKEVPDIDELVRNYPPPDGKKAVLGIGSHEFSSEKLGQIDELRRDGDDLMAKVSGVHPKLDELHGAGHLPNRAITVERTPSGMVLRRIGLQPEEDRGAGSLDRFHDSLFSTSEYQFAETPNLDHGWIEIFRAGDYTSQGKVKITAEQLQSVVDRYNPDFHEAPVVVGHPQNDAPAYGWIEQIALRGDTLLAKEKQVDPAFNELRVAGRFKKRSVAFYQDADGSPIYLRHVGWLGAQPPAVKGLGAAFDDKGRAFVEFEFEECKPKRREPRGTASPIVSRMKREGKWLTYYDEKGLPSVFAEMEKSGTQVEFVEPSGRLRSGSLAECLRNILDYLHPTLVDFDLDRRARAISRSHGVTYGEGMMLADQERLEDANAAKFAEGRGLYSGVAIHNEALALSRSEHISYCEALTRVANERPDLAARA